PPAAVPSQVNGADVGVIVPDVGFAAPRRNTATKQTKLAATKPLPSNQRVFFMDLPPQGNRSPDGDGSGIPKFRSRNFETGNKFKISKNGNDRNDRRQI